MAQAMLLICLLNESLEENIVRYGRRSDYRSSFEGGG